MKKLVCFLCVILLLFVTGCGKKTSFDDMDNYGGTTNTVEARDFEWSNIVLGDFIPKPVSTYGAILSNKDDKLDIYISKITSADYDKYVNDCIEMGYELDKELLSSSFSAYNSNGYSIKISFNSSKGSMEIKLNKEKEYKEIEWPTTGYGALIPIPESNVGNIEKNTDDKFIAYIGNTDKEAFENYIKKCRDNGFNIDESTSSDSFVAKNKDGYKLKVTYQGNNVIKIEMDEPIYDVTFDIECEENLLFSKYDVEIYIDGVYKGVLKHGTKEKYEVNMRKGSYEVRFVKDDESDVKGYINVDVTKDETIKLQIHCYNSKIEAVLKSGGKGSSNPTPTAVPEEKETPNPTATPKATATPKPKATAKPTATPKIDVCAGVDYEIRAKKEFEKAGKKFYPYGIKFDWILDLKDFTYKGKCIWHIEVGVDVTNKYGATRKGAVAKGDVDFKKSMVKNFVVK